MQAGRSCLSCHKPYGLCRIRRIPKAAHLGRRFGLCQSKRLGDWRMNSRRTDNPVRLCQRRTGLSVLRLNFVDRNGHRALRGFAAAPGPRVAVQLSGSLRRTTGSTLLGFAGKGGSNDQVGSEYASGCLSFRLTAVGSLLGGAVTSGSLGVDSGSSLGWGGGSLDGLLLGEASSGDDAAPCDLVSRDVAACDATGAVGKKTGRVGTARSRGLSAVAKALCWPGAVEPVRQCWHPRQFDCLHFDGQWPWRLPSSTCQVPLEAQPIVARRVTESSTARRKRPSTANTSSTRKRVHLERSERVHLERSERVHLVRSGCTRLRVELVD